MTGKRARRAPGLAAFWRSTSVKFLSLLALFAIVPFIVYQQLSTAEQQRAELLLHSIQEQGRLVAVGIAPWLPADAAKELPAVGKLLEPYASGQINIKLLWRPAALIEQDQLYYVGSVPSVRAEYLDEEVRKLREVGIISRVLGSCSGGGPAAAGFARPGGGKEILTSITPILKGEQCWIVITAASESFLDDIGFGTPYWMSREIILSGAIYLAVLVFTGRLLLSVWANLRRFWRLAGRLPTARSGEPSFAAINRATELDGVAHALDDMVQSLRSSAQSVREGAEERAHAFKTPIATIVQSLQPIRRALAGDDGRARRALDLIEGSVERLERLLAESHKSDEIIAQMIDPPREAVDLTSLVRNTAAGYIDTLLAQERDTEIVTVLPDRPVIVRGDADLVETVLENLLDNAVDFSPAAGRIEVSLTTADGRATLAIADSGPGVTPESLPRLFDRHYSTRDGHGDGTAPPHLGIGLWVVRRNVEALGGSVAAANRDGGGLVVDVSLPVLG